ncbi:WhiB family transcription factor [Streptomyces phage Stuff]|nr:WhiB family transcription factor [Streptomyces phage Stuff]
MWTIRIDGNPTITCRTPVAALRNYEGAKHWKTRGHDVALYRAGARVIPERPWTPRSTSMELNRVTPPWHKDAACRNLGSADLIFFPVKSVEDRIGAGEAKAYCDVCPVMYECLKAALDGNEHGTWGGLTHSERLRLKSKMKPSDYATLDALQDYLEVQMPRCSACDRHRKEKDGSGMCAECFYAARRAEEAKKPKPECRIKDCTTEVHARGKCVKHYHAALRAQEKKATAAGKAKAATVEQDDMAVAS